jgi:RHS repeat-associated protein
MSLLDVNITESGYAFIWVSNETENSKVWFDDLQIIHTESPIIQTDDYYPFGMNLASSYQRVDAVNNNFKYNGFEFQEDLNLNLYDYQARYYDPALGRFINVDPAADLMRRHSPYNYAFDNPIRFIDPDGMIATDIILDEVERSKFDMQNYPDNHNTQSRENNAKSYYSGGGSEKPKADDLDPGSVLDGFKYIFRSTKAILFEILDPHGKKRKKDQELDEKNSTPVKVDEPVAEDNPEQHAVDYGNINPEVSDNRIVLYQEGFAEPNGDSVILQMSNETSPGVRPVIKGKGLIPTTGYGKRRERPVSSYDSLIHKIIPKRK